MRANAQVAEGCACGRLHRALSLALLVSTGLACDYTRPTAPVQFDLEAAVGFWWGDETGLFRDSAEWTLDVTVATDDSVVATLVGISGPGHRFTRSDTTVFAIRATHISTESPRNAHGEICQLHPAGGGTCDPSGVTLVHLDWWAPAGRIKAFLQATFVKRWIWFTDSLDDLERCRLAPTSRSELERCRS